MKPKDKFEKIRDGWAMGLSDKEIACYAGYKTYKEFEKDLKENPELLELKDLLLNNTRMRAKVNISNRIKSGDYKTSQWYLEKRDLDFSTKVVHDQNVTTTLTIDDKRKAFEKLSDEILGGDK